MTNPIIISIKSLKLTKIKKTNIHKYKPYGIILFSITTITHLISTAVITHLSMETITPIMVMEIITTIQEI